MLCEYVNDDDDFNDFAFEDEQQQLINNNKNNNKGFCCCFCYSCCISQLRLLFFHIFFFSFIYLFIYLFACSWNCVANLWYFGELINVKLLFILYFLYSRLFSSFNFIKTKLYSFKSEWIRSLIQYVFMNTYTRYLGQLFRFLLLLKIFLISFNNAWSIHIFFFYATSTLWLLNFILL